MDNILELLMTTVRHPVQYLLAAHRAVKEKIHGKVRIYELAKKLNRNSKDILDELAIWALKGSRIPQYR